MKNRNNSIFMNRMRMIMRKRENWINCITQLNYLLLLSLLKILDTIWWPMYLKIVDLKKFFSIKFPLKYSSSENIFILKFKIYLFFYVYNYSSNLMITDILILSKKIYYYRGGGSRLKKSRFLIIIIYFS